MGQHVDPFFQSQEWMEVRYRALEASTGACACCGSRGHPSNPLQVDHIKPRSKFPELALVFSNLQVLCRSCNMGKGNRTDTDWRFVASQELATINKLEPEKRFRLQQLSWLSLNGDSKQIRTAAHKEYQKLRREAEMALIRDCP